MNINISNANRNIYLALISIASLLALLLINFTTIYYLYLVLLVLIVLSLKPQLGVYTMALTLPLTYISVTTPWGSLMPFDYVLSSFVLIGFCINTFVVSVKKREIPKISFPVFFPFAIFVSVSVLSAFYADDTFSGLRFIFKNILFFYFAYIFLPVNVLTDSKRLKKAILSFSTSALILSIVTFVTSVNAYDGVKNVFRFKLISYEMQSSLINNLHNISNGLITMFPFATEHTLLVETLLPGIFMLLSLKYWYKNERLNKFINMAVAFMVVVLIGTFSRGAWIALAVSSLLYVLVVNRVKLKKIALVAPIVLLLLYPVFFYMYKIQTNYKIGVSSTQSRLLSMQIGLKSFAENPWLGNGPGTFADILNDNARYVGKFGNPVDALGVWQKVLVENGLIGSVAFGFFVISIIFIYIRGVKLNKAKVLVVSLVIGALSIFVYEFTNTSYYNGKMWLPISLALISSNLLIKKYEQESK